MLDQILVPLEGSALAECVLPHTQAIAQAMGSQLLLLHVVAEPKLDNQPQVDPLNWYLRKAEAQSYMGQVSRTWEQTGQPITNVLLEGRTAERVVAYAHDHNMDLVVLSNHSEGGVAQKVIWQIRKSVLLVRAEWPTADPLTPLRYRRILVPLDGSLRAESVLPIATRLAQTHEAELLLLHIVARPEMVQRHTLTAADNALSEQIVQSNLSAATTYLTQLQQRLPFATQTRLVVSDNVIATLHELVAQEQVDLLLLSAHGHSGGCERPYGNTTTNFITYGRVPLLIIQDVPYHKNGSNGSNGSQGATNGHAPGGQPLANTNYAH